MDAGFGLYGVLMAATAVQTVRHARAGRLRRHRVWGLRLFALAVGSWLYRMEYGFWVLLFDGAGHTDTFTGPFDQVMAFFFYLPNLAVVEALVRSEGVELRPATRVGVALGLTACSGLVVLATMEFTRIQWGPWLLRLLG